MDGFPLPPLEMITCARCGCEFPNRRIERSVMTKHCPRCARPTPASGVTAGRIQGLEVYSPSGLRGVIKGKWKVGEPVTIYWENSCHGTYETAIK